MQDAAPSGPAHLEMVRGPPAGAAGSRILSLIYFHRFLIFCVILFSLFFAWNRFQAWRAPNGSAINLVSAVFLVVIAAAFALYLRTVKGRGDRDRRS